MSKSENVENQICRFSKFPILHMSRFPDFLIFRFAVLPGRFRVGLFSFPACQIFHTVQMNRFSKIFRFLKFAVLAVSRDFQIVQIFQMKK